MPKVKKKGRGKTLRTRTIHPKGRPDKVIRVDVMSKPGPRGGKTIAGPVRTVKKAKKRRKR